jgi:hypothetical protein
VAKKNFKKGRTVKELQSYISEDEKLSIRHQCELIEISRSTVYYKSVGESEENLRIMRLMDEHYLDHPTEGVLQLQDFLFLYGFLVNPKRVRRLLRKMGLMAIYPKRNLSKLGNAKYIRPYLLKGLTIDHPNHVWAIDNIFIERLWRTVKRDYVYLHPAENGTELYSGLKSFFFYYNTQKSHQGIGRITPQKLYGKAA